jgi:hypothetical protein
MHAGPQNNTTKVLPPNWLRFLQPVTQARMKHLSVIRVAAADRATAFATSTQVASS